MLSTVRYKVRLAQRSETNAFNREVQGAIGTTERNEYMNIYNTSKCSEAAQKHHDAATNLANTSSEGAPGGVVPPRRYGIRRRGTEMLPRSSSDDPKSCRIQMWSCWLEST